MQTETETEEEEINYNFPDQPATPAENARLIDWRFNAFVLTLQERHVEKNKVITGEIYSTVEIIDGSKPKGKANRKAFVIFALPIA